MIQVIREEGCDSGHDYMCWHRLESCEREGGNAWSARLMIWLVACLFLLNDDF